MLPFSAGTCYPHAAAVLGERVIRPSISDDALRRYRTAAGSLCTSARRLVTQYPVGRNAGRNRSEIKAGRKGEGATANVRGRMVEKEEVEEKYEEAQDGEEAEEEEDEDEEENEDEEYEEDDDDEEDNIAVRMRVTRLIRQYGRDGNVAAAVQAFTDMQVRCFASIKEHSWSLGSHVVGKARI